MITLLLACDASLFVDKDDDQPTYRDTSNDGRPQEEGEDSEDTGTPACSSCPTLTVVDTKCGTGSPASAGFEVPAGMPMMYQFFEVYESPDGWISVNDITDFSPLTAGTGFSLTCPSAATFSHYRLTWWGE